MSRPSDQSADAPRMKNYGWDSVKLSDAYSLEELNILRERVMVEHAYPRDARGRPMGRGRESLYLYDKAGCWKLDRLAWAVWHKLEAKRRQEAA